MGFLAGAALSGLGSLFGGLFGSSASSQASQQYIQALQSAQQSLEGTENKGLGQYSPYLAAGTSATNSLQNLLGTPGQGLLQNWNQQFQAPTAAQAAQTPGYQFQLQQGLGALQNSAAGQGSLLTGRTLAGLNNFAQGTASTNYQNTFNNALTQYQTAYNSFLNNQQNTYNRLAGQSGQGLGAAGGAAGLIGNIGGDIASLYGQQGAAKAQGTIGSANALSSGIGGLFNGIGGGLTLGALNGTSNFGPQWSGGYNMGPPLAPAVPGLEQTPTNLGF